MAKRRRAGRRAAKRSGTPDPAGSPSVVELAVYGLLATLVAVGVLIANDRPWWHAAIVVAGAIVVVIALTIVSSRPGPERTRHTPGGQRRRRP